MLVSCYNSVSDNADVNVLLLRSKSFGIASDDELLVGRNDVYLHLRAGLRDAGRCDRTGNVIVDLGIDLDAEELKSLGSSLADLGGILADTCGKYDGVKSAHRCCKRADIFLDLIAKDLHGKRRILIAGISCGGNISAVGRNSRNAEEAALLVHEVAHFRGRDVLLFHQEGNDRRVDASAAGTHDGSCERREAHRGIHDLTALDGRDRRAVSKMAGDDLRILGRLVQELQHLAADVSVRGSVEAVTADLVLFDQLLRDRVGICLLRHGLMECGIENEDLRNSGHCVHASSDSHQVRNGMERSQIAAKLKLRDYLVVNDDRLREVGTSVDDTMADCLDLVHACNASVHGICQSSNKDSGRLRMVGHRKIRYVFILSGYLMHDAAVNTDSLAVSLCLDLIGRGIEKLILQGAAACVDNEYVHFFPPKKIIYDPLYNILFYFSSMLRQIEKNTLKAVGKLRSVAVISEFNPFHNGHAHLLSEIKRTLGADTYVTAIMSGWYVQRGDVAVASPYTRAESALRSGFDLVLELPFPYSISSATDFADAGVTIADRLSCFDTLSFGCECKDPGILTRLAELRASDAFLQTVKELRETERGRRIGFARLAREALQILSGNPTLEVPPNLTLAIEYLCAIKRHGSNLLPLPILREGDGYECETPNHPNLASAKSIRPLLSLENIDILKRYIGAEAVKPLLADLEDGFAPVQLSHRLSDAVLAFFIALSEAAPSPFGELDEAEEDLVRRLSLAARDSLDLDDLIRRVSARSYTDAYVRRVVLRTFLGVTSSELRTPPAYTRVLGFTERGREILRIAKQRGSVSLLTKTADYLSLPEPAARQAKRALSADRFCYMAMPRPRPASDAFRGTPRHILSDPAE